MASYASSDDLADRWRPLTDAEASRADVLLGSASRLIARAFVAAGVDLTAHLAEGRLQVEDLTDVACFMVKRAMVADVGVSQEQQSVGSVSVGRTYANPSGDLYLSKLERVTLGLGVKTGRAFSVPMWRD